MPASQPQAMAAGRSAPASTICSALSESFFAEFRRCRAVSCQEILGQFKAQEIKAGTLAGQDTGREGGCGFQHQPIATRLHKIACEQERIGIGQHIFRIKPNDQPGPLALRHDGIEA